MTISIGNSVLSPDFLRVGIVVSEGPNGTHGILFDNGATSFLEDSISEAGKVTIVDVPEGEAAVFGLVNSNFWTSNQIFLAPESTPARPLEGWAEDWEGNKKIFTVIEYFTVPASGSLVLVQLQSLDAEENTVISAAGAQQTVTLNYP